MAALNLLTLIKPWKTSRLCGAKLVIVGCGDVGLRLAGLASKQVKVLALGRTPPITSARLEHQHFQFINIDLDAVDVASRRKLRRYATLAPWAVYLVPPPAYGVDDSRIRRFLAQSQIKIKANKPKPKVKIVQKVGQKLIYVSTTGVYGKAALDGAWVTETTPLKPTEPRGQRRIAAEQRLSASTIAHITVLRAPGIYAGDRLPIERLQKGLPALIDAHDVPTNHIHADDLARLCWLALFKSRNRRTYNAADGQPMMHAAYLRAVAERFKLPIPPQLPRAEVQKALSPIAWSMLSGGRRVSSQRLLGEWGIKLHYSSIGAFLTAEKLV